MHGEQRLLVEVEMRLVVQRGRLAIGVLQHERHARPAIFQLGVRVLLHVHFRIGRIARKRLERLFQNVVHPDAGNRMPALLHDPRIIQRQRHGPRDRLQPGLVYHQLIPVPTVDVDHFPPRFVGRDKPEVDAEWLLAELHLHPLLDQAPLHQFFAGENRRIVGDLGECLLALLGDRHQLGQRPLPQ